MKWLQAGTAYLDWLTVDRPVTRDYARHQAVKMVEMGATVHQYMVQVGGAVIYDSSLAPRSPGLAFDLLEALVAENHNRGNRLIACWLGTLPGNALQAREHPDWIVRGPDGSPFILVCYNGPLRDFVFAQVREVLTNYAVDGIYFDQLMTGCYCAYCRQQFAEIYGKELPFSSDTPASYRYGHIYWGNPNERELEEFADAKRVAFLRNVRHSIDEIRPDTALVANHLVGPRARLGRGIVDGFLPEVVAGTRTEGGHGSRDTIGVMADRTLTERYGGAPAYGEVKYDNYTPRSVPLVHGILQSAAAVANGNPIVFRDQDALDTDPEPKRRRLFTALRELSNVHAEAVDTAPIRYAALLHSHATQRQRGDAYDASFYGWYRLLCEEHIPFAIVTEDDIACGALSDYACLLLGNAEILPTAVVAKVEQFVAEGGGLLASYRTGLGTGSAPEPKSDGTAIDPLSDLLGVTRFDTLSHHRQVADLSPHVPVPSQHASDFFYGRVRNDAPAFMDDLTGVRLDFEAPVMQAEPRKGTTVVADVLDFDQALINTALFNRRMPFAGVPQMPLTTVHGNVVYFAAPVERAAARESCDELNQLLVKCIRHVGGALPFTVENAPPTVLVMGREAPAGQSVFFFVNLSATPTSRGYFRHVAPVHDITLHIPLPNDRTTSAWDLHGSALETNYTDGKLSVRLPRLEFYAAVWIDRGIS